MKKQSRILGFIAVLAIIGLLVTACPDPDIIVSFDNVTANGSALQTTTTQLYLTFNQSIPGLNIDHILLTGVSGVNKTSLVGPGPIYTLNISGFTDSGTLNVNITASILGYSITSPYRQVEIFYVVCNCCVDCDDDCEGECCDECECGLTGGDDDCVVCGDNPCTCDTGGDDECGVCGNDPCTCDPQGGDDCGVCGNDPCSCDTGGGDDCNVCGNDPCTCDTGGGDDCGICGNNPCTCGLGDGDDVGIGIGYPPVNFYLNETLVQGENTQIVQGTGTYTVSIASGTYTEIIWYLNGNIVAEGPTRTSIILSKQTAGTYHVTVEAIPAGETKIISSHKFVVQ